MPTRSAPLSRGGAGKSLALLAIWVSAGACSWGPLRAGGAESRPAVEGKLDDGLDGRADVMAPAFVRMSDQLLRRGGDYEAFCRTHQRDKRSALRALVLKALRAKSDASWKAMVPLLRQLRADGQIRAVARFWIVNGIACDATPQACRTLAARGEVAIIYRQR